MVESLALDRPGEGVGVCAACGVVAPIKRSVEEWAIKDHAPSASLVEPCRRHAWDDLAHFDGVTKCRCEHAKGSIK